MVRSLFLVLFLVFRLGLPAAGNAVQIDGLYGRFSLAAEEFALLALHQLHDADAAAGERGADVELHSGSRLQGRQAAALGPAYAREPGWIVRHLGPPMLDVAGFVGPRELYRGMRIDVAEFFDSAPGCPHMGGVEGKTLTVMRPKRPGDQEQTGD